MTRRPYGGESAMEVAESHGLDEPTPVTVADDDPYDITDDGEKVER
jgi:hypothetical protein